jgi:drug/metabolite transporter (DMT)-like permease
MAEGPISTGTFSKSPSKLSSPFLAWTFVIIWGSGFLATKTGIQYAAPFTFLCLRFAFGIACLIPVLLWLKPAWPKRFSGWFHIVIAGLLMHAIHLSGSHYGQYEGLTAGVVAIILAAQPLLTAIIATWLLHERASNKQWAGIVIGLAGVALVVWHKIDVNAMNAKSLTALIVALLALTIGTLYQRRYLRDVDLFAASFIQFIVSLIVLTPLSFAVEGAKVAWSWPLVGSVTFLVIFASIFAVSALHTLMRRGEATRVSSILYLPPVVAVLVEWLLFQLTPTMLTVAGMMIVAVGVWLASATNADKKSNKPA